MPKILPVGYKIKIKCAKAQVKLKPDEEMVWDEKSKKYEIRVKSSIIHTLATERYTEEDLKEGAEKGTVVAMGADCYTDKAAPWCAVGDVVYYKRYSGHGFEEEGERYELVNDDQIVGKEVGE